jgi:hypothetical protein
MAPLAAERLREALATLRLVEVSRTGICAIARRSEEI